MLFRSLRTIMTQLHGLGQSFYSDRPEIDRPPLINRLMIQGLLSFTAGNTHRLLQSAIESCQIQNRIPEWKALLESCINSERIHGVPTTPMTFKSHPANQVSLFNNMFSPVEHPNFAPFLPVQQPVMPSFDPTWQPNACIQTAHMPTNHSAMFGPRFHNQPVRPPFFNHRLAHNNLPVQMHEIGRAHV